MANDTISDIPANNTWTSAIDPSSAAAAKKKKSSGIDMQGFLKLMAAQMQNQSLTSSSTDNSQYITQMTLFTAIQAMNTQTSEANKQYASSLIGSDVLIKTIDKTTGKPDIFTGTVSKAIFNSSDGDSAIQIGDKTYDLSDIAEVYGPHGTQTAADREYAASLVGKAVSVRTVGSDGVVHSETGTVQNTSYDPNTGASTITISDGHTFSISDVTGVIATDRE